MQMGGSGNNRRTTADLQKVEEEIKLNYNKCKANDFQKLKAKDFQKSIIIIVIEKFSACFQLQLLYCSSR